MTQLYIIGCWETAGHAKHQYGVEDFHDQAIDGSARSIGPLVPVELLGVGEFADRCDPVLKKSTIYVYKSNGRLPEPDLMVNNNNTALWLDSTVDRWNEER